MDAGAITKHHDPNPDENPWVHGKPPVENVAVVAYSPNWPERFRELAYAIKTTLGDAALSIEHVGSTSVPGLAAKPVIDIDLTVKDPADEPSYAPQLEGIGYDLCVREPSWHEHRCFRLEALRVNLHVFGPDCPEAIRHMMFREWLKSHPDDLRLYERAKLGALTGANGVAEYNLRKQPVIREIYARMFKAAELL